jgi:hypothetical protein
MRQGLVRPALSEPDATVAVIGPIGSPVPRKPSKVRVFGIWIVGKSACLTSTSPARTAEKTRDRRSEPVG